MLQRAKDGQHASRYALLRITDLALMSGSHLECARPCRGWSFRIGVPPFARPAAPSTREGYPCPTINS